MRISGDLEIIMDAKHILECVAKDEGLCINYGQIYYVAMDFLKKISCDGVYDLPINITSILEKLNLEVIKDDLNEFMKGEDFHKVNRIIGKISIRPDFFSNEPKVSIYVEEKETPAMVNYALAHELCHLILNIDGDRYTDDYCTMPMLPKESDELVADAFAIFLLIPLDKFYELFVDYVNMVKSSGDVLIRTEDWLNYLGSVARVPRYYVACAYEYIRHVTYLMYRIHTANELQKRDLGEKYGKEILRLYDWVKDVIDDEILHLLYQ